MKKNTITRMLALALALIMALAVTLIPASAADTGKSFSDVPANHWAAKEIQYAVDNGIASGYGDGTFKPDAAVTNAQFITFLARAVYSGEIDKSAAPYYAGALKALNAHGILDGSYKYTDASPFPVDFNKNLTGDVAGKNVSRYNAATMLWNVLNEKGIARPTSNEWSPIYNKLTDKANIPANHFSGVIYLCTFGIMDTQNGAFNGNGTVSRAQACVMLYRLIQKLGGAAVTANPGTTVPAGTATQPVISTGDQHVLTNGKPITEDNVLEILEQIKKDYPDGSLYMPVSSEWVTRPDGTGYQRLIPGTGYFSDAIHGYTQREGGCNGWAAMCSDLIFGRYSNNKAHVLEDHSKIRPGDILIARDAKTKKVYHHSIIVSKYGADTEEWNGQTIYGVYTSGSGAGTNLVSWPNAVNVAANAGGAFEAWDNAGGIEWVITTRYPD